MRLPAIQAAGRVAVEATPDSARTAKLPSPNSSIQ